jgi:hypothetical protein
MTPPTCKQLWNEELKRVASEADPTWRHGSYMAEVFFREEDATFWQVEYRKSTDGETNELREGSASITQVYPHEVMTTVYTTEPTK